MSVIAGLSSAVSAALPPISPHLHGHKRGSHVQSAADSSGGTQQVPTGLQQNLFGSLLNSLGQVIGLQATTPAGAATGSASSAATGTSSAAAAGTASAAAIGSAAGSANVPIVGAGISGSTANPVSAAARTSLTLRQNYLNNLLHHPQLDGSPAAKLAGSTLNVTA